MLGLIHRAAIIATLLQSAFWLQHGLNVAWLVSEDGELVAGCVRDLLDECEEVVDGYVAGDDLGHMTRVVAEPVKCDQDEMQLDVPVGGRKK